MPEGELEAAVVRNVTHYNHPSGTCRMGRPDDRDAVVDATGAAIGIEGLSVVDASIMPVLPRVPINPTTVLISEKLGPAPRRPGLTTTHHHRRYRDVPQLHRVQEPLGAR